jgi:hypothetical protein
MQNGGDRETAGEPNSNWEVHELPYPVGKRYGDDGVDGRSWFQYFELYCDLQKWPRSIKRKMLMLSVNAEELEMWVKHLVVTEKATWEDIRKAFREQEDTKLDSTDSNSIMTKLEEITMRQGDSFADYKVKFMREHRNLRPEYQKNN